MRVTPLTVGKVPGSPIAGAGAGAGAGVGGGTTVGEAGVAGTIVGGIVGAIGFNVGSASSTAPVAALEAGFDDDSGVGAGAVV